MGPSGRKWDPTSQASQHKVALAAKRAAGEAELMKERIRELDEERDMGFLAPGETTAAPAEASRLGFMTARPPGLEEKKQKESVVAYSHDEAALAFEAARSKRMRAKEGLTAVEVEVEVEEQQEEEAAPAPKRVRLDLTCQRCGEVGHEAASKDCPMRNFNPHEEAREEARRQPASSTAATSTAAAVKNRLVLKSAAAQLEAQSRGIAAGFGKQNDGYLILEDDEEPEPTEEEAVMATLSTREKKALLKRLAQLEGGGVDMEEKDAKKSAKKAKKKLKKKEEKKEKKKKKKKKKKKASSSSSDSDDDDSD